MKVFVTESRLLHGAYWRYECSSNDILPGKNCFKLVRTGKTLGIVLKSKEEN